MCVCVCVCVCVWVVCGVCVVCACVCVGGGVCARACQQCPYRANILTGLSGSAFNKKKLKQSIGFTYHEGKSPLQLCHTRRYRSRPRFAVVAIRNQHSAPESCTNLVGSANTSVSLMPSEPIMYIATVADVPASRCHPVITVIR